MTAVIVVVNMVVSCPLAISWSILLNLSLTSPRLCSWIVSPQAPCTHVPSLLHFHLAGLDIVRTSGKHGSPLHVMWCDYCACAHRSDDVETVSHAALVSEKDITTGICNTCSTRDHKGGKKSVLIHESYGINNHSSLLTIYYPFSLSGVHELQKKITTMLIHQLPSRYQP